ncbi:MAG: hypothetical protein H7235_07805 [Bdellovibrionaceae bacterium]|nr:hypothetical protein [Pseudobdellovibrionaceae bacterium]
MKSKGQSTDRGRVEIVVLKHPFTFNGQMIKRAIVEIDHINFGIDKRTFKLNATKRTNFSIKDVEKFLQLLDGEFLFARKYRGRFSRFEIRIDCPVQGQFLNKEFLLIFETNYDKADEIYTVTLYPGW